MNIVGDPHVVFRSIWTDRDRVRTSSILEELVPLRPRLDYLAGCVNHDDAVAKFWSCCRRLLAERAPEAVKIVGQLFRKFQLAAVGDEDSVRRLREDAAGRAPDVSGFSHGQRQGPFLGHTVLPGHVSTALLLHTVKYGYTKHSHT